MFAKDKNRGVSVIEREDVNFALGALIDRFCVEYHITKAQQSFLLWRLKYFTDAACARAIGISPETVMRWKKGNPKPPFVHAYNELFSATKLIAEKSMAHLGPMTVDVAAELLTATKKIPLAREEGKPPEMIEVPDYENRFKGASLVTDWLGERGAKGAQIQNPVYITIMNDFQELMKAKNKALVIEGEGHVVTEEGEGRGVYLQSGSGREEVS